LIVRIADNDIRQMIARRQASSAMRYVYGAIDRGG
jgi:hypothetical protein